MARNKRAQFGVNSDSEDLDRVEEPDVEESEVEIISPAQSDSESVSEPEPAPVVKKRKRSAPQKPAKEAEPAAKKPKLPAKKRKAIGVESDDEELVSSPVKSVKIKDKKESLAKGQIGKNSMWFLEQLWHESFQDRDVFQEHDAYYREALAQWTECVNLIVAELQQVDDTLPVYPAKDLIHRIYRDVRFSPDKRPYKRNLSASITRSGRKGPFAGYYFQVSARGQTLLAGGRWAMGKDDLATFRHSIMTDPSRLRAVIQDEAFVEMFGPAHSKTVDAPAKKKKIKKGAKDAAEEEEDKAEPAKETKKASANDDGLSKVQNIFGHDDELKKAPKGVAADHKDIDLLKLKTVAVLKYFTDEEARSADFAVKVGKAAAVMAPLVQLINDMLVPQSRQDDE